MTLKLVHHPSRPIINIISKNEAGIITSYCRIDIWKTFLPLYLEKHEKWTMKNPKLSSSCFLHYLIDISPSSLETNRDFSVHSSRSTSPPHTVALKLDLYSIFRVNMAFHMDLVSSLVFNTEKQNQNFFHWSL